MIVVSEFFFPMMGWSDEKGALHNPSARIARSSEQGNTVRTQIEGLRPLELASAAVEGIGVENDPGHSHEKVKSFEGSDLVSQSGLPLTVVLRGTGGGFVKIAPMNINCPKTCRIMVPPNVSVKLEARPFPASILDSWEGCATK